MTVAIAMGGSTNVLLHSVEIARAAGIDFWDEVMSQDDFNQLARRLPVLVNMRPFGDYSMVDVDAKGGLQVIVNELLEAGFLDGDRPHLHRRDPGRAGRAGWPRRRRIKTSSTRSRSPSRTRAGSVCSAATSRPTAGRSSRSPASRAA